MGITSGTQTYFHLVDILYLVNVWCFVWLNYFRWNFFHLFIYWVYPSQLYIVCLCLFWTLTQNDCLSLCFRHCCQAVEQVKNTTQFLRVPTCSKESFTHTRMHARTHARMHARTHTHSHTHLFTHFSTSTHPPTFSATHPVLFIHSLIYS